MSIRAVSWVLEHSETRLGDRLVLLAIADAAHDDGTESWQAVATIADKARMSERQVQRSLKRLEGGGHIEQTGVSHKGTRVFRVVMEADPRGGDNLSGVTNRAKGVTNRAQNVSEMSPEPSLEPSLEQNDDAARLCRLLADAVRERDPGSRIDPGHRRWRGAALALLDARTPEEVERVLRWAIADSFWRQHIVDMAALRKHFDKLVQQRAAAGIERPDGRPFMAEFD